MKSLFNAAAVVASLTLSSFSALHASPVTDSDVADYAATLNRIFTRGDMGVTVGPDDGSLSLTFSSFTLQADGSATALVKRFDRIANPQDSSFTFTLRPSAAGTMEFGVLLTGAEKELTYNIHKVDDTHITWADKTVTPYNNAYTKGKWQIEIDTFDISVDMHGLTNYVIYEQIQVLNADYVAAHYTEVTPTAGGKFLRDNLTGEQLTFRVDEAASLVNRGITAAPESKTLVWKQIAP